MFLRRLGTKPDSRGLVRKSLRGPRASTGWRSGRARLQVPFGQGPWRRLWVLLGPWPPLQWGQLSHLPTRKESWGSELKGSGLEDRKATFFDHKDPCVVTEAIPVSHGAFHWKIFADENTPRERLLWVMFSSLSWIHSELCTVAPQKLSRVTLQTRCHSLCLCSQPR